ncbi:Xaa-Pro peptidase family protein [Mesobacillus subterraneus]|uniref:M24 family metallopeptidase n=1 Tax=Mesobacillus subterraneus TaxID=285983 RepID=UPI00203DD4A0|nr:Xaa-Pro peptidase family protein [Mesobacillus subterraneus]MCM3576273.1 Xaa-Pro peptidase family protein [Mesobacillus subterraneus]
MKARITNLQEYFRTNEMTGGLITSKNNIFYLSGFDYEPHERFVGIFIFAEHEPVFVLPEMELDMLFNAGWVYDYLSYTDSEDVWEKIKRRLGFKISENGIIAVEESCISFKYIQKLQGILPKAKMKNLDKKLSEMRVIKSFDEINSLKIAAKYADYAVHLGISALYDGVTELEVLGEIEYQLKKRGIREMSFTPMVLFGKNASNPHGVTGENKLKAGDTVIFDLGVKYNGYSSDITRTVVYRNSSEEIEEIYDIVLKANRAALKECKVGNIISKIDEAARKVIVDAGYSQYFPHRIGHGLGIDVHEEPSLHSNNEELLKAGMVLTIEPGIYLPGVGGVRIEDDIVIMEEGPDLLTEFWRDIQVVRGKFK